MLLHCYSYNMASLTDCEVNEIDIDSNIFFYSPSPVITILKMNYHPKNSRKIVKKLGS